MALNINKVYLEYVKKIAQGNTVVVRGHRTYEVLNSSITCSIASPLVGLKLRKLGYKFALAEACWIINGDNRVATIEKYSPIIRRFSDNGDTFYGAYGPKIAAQIQYVVESLRKDIFSRQCVINIWRDSPPVSKDIPCTLSTQVIIRESDDGLRLNLINSMRSSDAWLGVPYDLFNFATLGLYLCLKLRRELGVYIAPGDITINAASGHLYTESKKAFLYDEQMVVDMLADESVQYDFKPCRISGFRDEYDFVSHLQDVLAGSTELRNEWLSELVHKSDSGDVL